MYIVYSKQLRNTIHTNTTPNTVYVQAVAHPKILKGREDKLSAPSSFIANAHNEIYAF